MSESAFGFRKDDYSNLPVASTWILPSS